MGIDVLSKAAARRFVQWTPGSVRDCVLWQGPGRVTYNTQPNLLDGACEDVSKWLSYNSGALSNQPNGVM